MKTSHKNIIAGSVLVAALPLLLAQCTKVKKDDDFKPSTPPPIGNYNNSSEVAAANLKAYWSFDAGTSKEEKSGALAVTENNATYVAGKKGKAVNLNRGFLAYNEITALNSLPDYTITAWINIANNKGTGANEGATNIFTMTRDASPTAYEWAGNVNMMMETGWYGTGSDTLLVKALNVTNTNGNQNWQDSRNDPASGGAQNFQGARKWVQVAISWEGATNKLLVYGNGQKISNPAWETRSGGPLTFWTPTRPVIGGWGTNVKGNPDGWQQKFFGMIDEVRVYNKALSAADMDALYRLEKAGR
jgi:hypothetical protein